MKKYKLVNGEGWEKSFVEGKTYKETDVDYLGQSVKDLQKAFRYDWELVVEEVELPKKYKLVNGEGWEKSFVEGKTYKETDVDYLGQSVKDLQKAFRYDWELVVEEVELPKKFKFLGDIEACGDDGSYRGLVIGDVYSLTDRCPDAEDVVEDYNFVKYYVEMYPNDWEEVVEQACDYSSSLSPISGFVFTSNESEGYEAPITKPFTDAEVVTLITFLNDNFEDFRLSLYLLELDTFMALPSKFMSGNECEMLIDKLEANDTPLTEAEKVTLITFLNDRVEDFRTFTIYDLDFEFYDKLDADEEFEVASLLIDKIELS